MSNTLSVTVRLFIKPKFSPFLFEKPNEIVMVLSIAISFGFRASSKERI